MQTIIIGLKAVRCNNGRIFINISMQEGEEVEKGEREEKEEAVILCFRGKSEHNNCNITPLRFYLFTNIFTVS